MIFNSLAFVIFLPLVLGLYAAIRRSLDARNITLLFASYVFYGWWDWRFLGLIAFSTLVDYYCALRMVESEGARKRLFLIASIVVNLGVLAFFKYANFFVGSATDLIQMLGFNADLPTLRVILPVGISFYTFQSMSYTIDVYREQMKPTRRFVDFALYVAFFPQLVAGPIERAKTLLPQIQQLRRFHGSQVTDGIWLIVLGYVKKVVIADRLGQIADLGFTSEAPVFGALEALIYVLAFAFQIYGDFSGYSDIARGVAKLMGFELMINFGKPYLVRNPSAFWRHWHISLSTWLRDYLYIPLGGNRGSSSRTYRNLMTTMLLGGLWHGAGWAFVIWGLYHGVLLAAHRLWSEFVVPRMLGGASSKSQRRRRLPTLLARLGNGGRTLFFFSLTCLGWLFFRVGTTSPDIHQARLVLNYLGRLTSGADLHSALPWLPSLVIFGGLGLWFQYRHEAMESFHDWKPVQQVLAVAVALTLITVFGVFDGAQFIYFQF